MMMMSGRRLLSMLMLVVCSMVAGDQWNVVVVDSIGSNGKSSSIRLDGNDVPHIAYQGDHLAGILKYTVRDGGEWDKWTVFSHDIVGYITLVLVPPQPPDTTWLPRISSFYSAPGYDAIFYSSFNGTIWSNEWVGAIYSGNESAMAMDFNNNPHISFMNSGSLNLMYAHYNGSDWLITVVDAAYMTGYSTSIAVEPGTDDHVHISYRDETNDRLMYAYFNGIDWSTSVVDADGNVGRYTSLALDSYNHPHISYEDYTNKALKYARWNGASWEITSVDTLATNVYATSLALDSQDNPHISYERNLGSLSYAHWNGTVWAITTVDPSIGGGQGLHSTSITLDSGDNPHISYWDGGEWDLKYAYYGPVGIEGQGPPEDFLLGSIYPNPAVTSVYVVFTVPLHSSVAFDVYDVSGRVVREMEESFDPGTHTVTLDGLETGVYFIRMQAGGFTASSRFLVLR